MRPELEGGPKDHMMARRRKFLDILLSETPANIERSQGMTLRFIETNLSDEQQAVARGYLENKQPFYLKEEAPGGGPADREQALYVFSADAESLGHAGHKVRLLYQDLLDAGLIDEAPPAEERLQIEAWLDSLGFERIEPVQWEGRKEAA